MSEKLNYIVFDLESYWPEGKEQDKIDTQIMRISVCGAYISWLPESDRYLAFMEEDIADFLALLRHADAVVAYNQLWFDMPLMQKYASFDLIKSVNNYDLLVEVQKQLGFKMKLDDLAKMNLGAQKTDSYEVYKHYYSQGKFAELTDYCMNDVKLTKELFDKVLQGKPLLYKDTLQTRELYLQSPSKDESAAKTEVAESLF